MVPVTKDGYAAGYLQGVATAGASDNNETATFPKAKVSVGVTYAVFSRGRVLQQRLGAGPWELYGFIYSNVAYIKVGALASD
jgi:hypothetical protein